MAIEDKSIGEIEVRIGLLNFFIRWLRSDDPMLTDPEYSRYVPAAIKHYEKQRGELMEVCRRKKVEPDPITIGLKPARMTGEAKMG